MSLATINGGDSAYVTNEAYQQTMHMGWFSIGMIFLIVVFFHKEIKTAFSTTEKKPISKPTDTSTSSGSSDPKVEQETTSQQ
jgi:hypothetical protein